MSKHTNNSTFIDGSNHTLDIKSFSSRPFLLVYHIVESLSFLKVDGAFNEKIPRSSKYNPIRG